MTIQIFFDGGTALNSICVYDGNTSTFDIVEVDRKSTNNELEYLALISAIEYAKKQYDMHDVEFCGDSEIIILQMTGEYGVHAKNLRPLHVEACRLLGLEMADTSHKFFKWVPREENLAGIEMEKEGNRRKNGR